MTRALLALALLTVASCVSAATLTVRATMPTQGAGPGCSVATDTLYSPLWLHVRWTGPVGARPELVGHDSLLTMPGAEALWQRTDLASGIYRMSVWASNRAGGGCDSAYVDTTSVRPGRVEVTR
ncbi:MAG: hypothetical protein ACT4PE_05625 [Candidatus Eiseniibacteriota bacterium]